MWKYIDIHAKNLFGKKDQSKMLFSFSVKIYPLEKALVCLCEGNKHAIGEFTIFLLMFIMNSISIGHWKTHYYLALFGSARTLQLSI